MPPHGIHSTGGPLQPPLSTSRHASAPATSVPATADWVSGAKNQPALRRLKKKQKERARRQRRGEARRCMTNDGHVVDGVPDDISADTTAQVADPVATGCCTEYVGSRKQVVVGGARDEPSADKKIQATQPAASCRAEHVDSNNRVVAVAVAVAAEHKQVVVGGAQAESFADNKPPQAIHPAATRRTDDVSPSKQVAAVAVVAAADHTEAKDEVQHEASGENTDQAAQPSTTLEEDLGSCSQVAAVVVEVGVGVGVEVKVGAVGAEVEVAEPSSPSAPAIPTVNDIAADQKALARARLGSLLLVLINKFRMSKAARERLKVTQNVATKAVEEASDQSSSEKSAADLAEVLTAKAKAEGLEPAVAARAFAEECAQRVAERERLEERIRIDVIKEVDDRAEELSIKKVWPVPLCVCRMGF